MERISSLDDIEILKAFICNGFPSLDYRDNIAIAKHP